MDTNDMCDFTEVANDNSIKDIRDVICKDTPVKTEINKPCIDNIDAYNRDKQLITTSLSDRYNRQKYKFYSTSKWYCGQ